MGHHGALTGKGRKRRATAAAAAGTAPLRVCIATETYFPLVNGVSRALDRLVRHLVAGGHRVLLLTPEYRDGVAPRPAGVDLLTFSGWPLPAYPEIMLCPVRPARIRAVLDDFRPHVVHVATEGPLGWAALQAARSARRPVVSSFHTHFAQYLRFYGYGWLEGCTWGYLRWFHNRTAATLCPSGSVRDELRGQGFRNVQVWTRGVDGERFHPAWRSPALRTAWGLGDKELALGYVGRIAAEKNLDLLLDTFVQLRHDHAAHLILVGDGPHRAALERRRVPGVVFTGYRRGEALAAAFASCDLFLFPSLTETLGNVLLEAMASGVPAVGFRAPGSVDVIRPGETGVLVDETTPEALAAAVAPLLRSPEALQRMGRTAREWAVTRTWDAVNAVVVDAYRRAAQRESRPHLGLARA